ncbi:MAG TPA: ribonuclease HII [Burkholderiales bacterium]|nr:ribonuclease HII [Burkholderiales bacterium]
MSARGPACGVDEAGRGPLAGPVFAAAVVLGRGARISGLADSKQLTERQRLELAEEIRARAVSWAVATASVEEIDSLNILRASLLAMGRAVERLAVTPHRALIDGLYCPELAMPARAIVRGDATVAAISAASIMAKVARDEEMQAVHRLHPGYGFDRHKGYATSEHLEALRRLGACEAHRRSFAPVREALVMEFRLF